MTDTINVPLLPTKEMLEAAISHALSVSISGDYTWHNYMQDLYVLMITSAPVQHSDDVANDAARWGMLVQIYDHVLTHPDSRTHDAEYGRYKAAIEAGLGITGAIDAAMAGGE